MLPKSKNLKNVDLFIKFQPSLGIGGDLFDCVEVDGKVWFVIADVTGHGIAAGMASSMVKVMFRSNLEKKDITPSGVLSAINKTVFSIFDFGASVNFVMFTAFIGCIEGEKFSYSNAGQPYPLLIKAKDKIVRSLDINGLLIGLIEGATFDERVEELDVGDTIFVYTDGLFSSGKKSDFKNWTLVEYFTNVHKDLAINDEKLFLNKAFNHFKLMHMTDYGDFTDDVAMMMLKLK
jgi:sigma-B regulation protein RsbU (phosphoserine phosphatase)